MRSQQNNSQLPMHQVLLKSEILIHGHKGVELLLRGVEQRSVVQVRPSTLMRRLRAVTWQQAGECARKIAIQQDAHRTYAAGEINARFASSRTATACSRETLGNSSKK